MNELWDWLIDYMIYEPKTSVQIMSSLLLTLILFNLSELFRPFFLSLSLLPEHD
jgi:hypothetical protein